VSAIDAALADYEQAIQVGYSENTLDRYEAEESTELLASARAELASLRTRLATAEKHLDAATTEATRLGAALDSEQAKVARLTIEVAEVEADRAAALAKVQEAGKVVEVARAFVEIAEAAIRHHENRGKGGQQVSYHGDFAMVPPSAVSRLRWWADCFRAALASLPPEPGK
jgi:chromosome segregation ATPase